MKMYIWENPYEVRYGDSLSKIVIPPEAIETIAPPAPGKSVKGWLNVYFTKMTPTIHNTREMADPNAYNDRLACIEIDVEEGEGLS